MANPVDSSDQKYRQYHPYQSVYDVPINKLYNLSTSPDYLFEEEIKRNRTWGDNLAYFTGSGYLAGAIVGAARGSIDGIRAAESTDNLKIRLSRVLNSGGHIGRRYGNNVGVVGLIFSGLEGGFTYFRDTDDVFNTVFAGLGTGALYRAAKGVKMAAVAGAVGGIAAALAVAGKQVAKRYVPI